MKIVIDTNVVISGIFFGGNPRKVIEAVVDGNLNAYATPEIVEEYTEIIESMIERKQGRLNQNTLFPFFSALKIIEGASIVNVCRDPDDDKFIGCAIDSKALYIVSGDNDLLDIQEYEGVQIITAKEFCEMYMM